MKGSSNRRRSNGRGHKMRGGDMGPGGNNPMKGEMGRVNPAVLMVHGLEATMNPYKLFNLLCLFAVQECQ